MNSGELLRINKQKNPEDKSIYFQIQIMFQNLTNNINTVMFIICLFFPKAKVISYFFNSAIKLY